MAFSQRARAYTLNPTLPCPTLPLSPRALSDSSIIPAAGRLCLKLKKVLRQKTSKQNPAGSRRENRKNEKQIVAASYATRISAANL